MFIDLSNFNTENVVDMSSMFEDSSVTTLDLSNFDTSNVEDMSSMFYSCDSLTSLTIDSQKFNTSKVTDMSSMFSGCSNLTFNASQFNITSVQSFNYFNNNATGVVAPALWSGGEGVTTTA